MDPETEAELRRQIEDLRVELESVKADNVALREQLLRLDEDT